MTRLLPDGVTVADLLGKALASIGPDNTGSEQAEARRYPSGGVVWDIRDDPLRPWRNKARSIAAHQENLNERELQFASDMAVRRDPPTHRQAEWLDSLAERIRSRCAA